MPQDNGVPGFLWQNGGNTTFHTSLQTTPYKILYGYDPIQLNICALEPTFSFRRYPS